jgi:hypothetical protein
MNTSSHVEGHSEHEALPLGPFEGDPWCGSIQESEGTLHAVVRHDRIGRVEPPPLFATGILSFQSEHI